MALVFDIGSIVNCFAENVLLKNRTGAYDINGRWVENPAADATILATVQPDKSRDLDNQDYGSQANGNMAFWSRTKINPVDEDSGIPGDVIQFKGKDYKIISVRFWDSYGYYRAVGELLSQERKGG